MALTIEEVRAKSEARISSLQPVVQAAARKLLDRCYDRGVPIIITQGLRTYAEQDALYAKGRTLPGPIVTNARGGESNHNFGFAFDFALLLPDGRSVSWDEARDGDVDQVRDWAEVIEEGAKLGLEEGIYWKFRDAPHMQLAFGLSVAQFRAGKRPTQAQIDAAYAIINKVGESDPMTAQEKAAFDALVKRVEEQDKQIQALTASQPAQLSTVPAWAKGPIERAVAAGAISDTSGSYDFYRLVTILDKLRTFSVTAPKN